jgi:hypothetical protein
MNTVHTIYSCIQRSAAPLLILIAVAGAHSLRADALDHSAFKADVSRSAATTMPAFTVDEPASAKTHTLFMGADIAINLDRDEYRVRDVFGSNWVIEVNGLERKISAKEAPLDLKITPTLKLTEISATVVGFRKVPAYSYDNDPEVMLTRGLSESASISSDLLANAQNALARVDSSMNKALGASADFVGADDQFSANAMLQTAKYSYSNLHSNKVGPGGVALTAGTAPTAVADPLDLGGALSPAVAAAAIAAASNIGQTKNGNEPAGRLATMGLDAMDVEFDIRASKPLHNPYVVTMTRFRAPGAKPGMVQNLVYAEAIHPIDEHLSHVHFVETGFPFNYELIDFQFHVYNRGEEIATNISADRVELTRDEAFQYVRLEYIGAHRGETLPPAPAMGKLPSDLRSLLSAGKYAKAYYVRVSKEGLAYEAFADPACTQRVGDEYLDSVIKRIRFKPALNDGRPVEGVASITLGQLAI